MSSSSSSSSSSDSEIQSRKRKRKDVALPPAEDSDSDSSSSSADEEDEPVVSHAEKRRQKKAEKAKEKASTTESTPAKKKTKLGDGTAKASKGNAAEKEKRQNSVWVGNLSYYCTPEDLKGFFDGVGEITRINMPKKPGSKENNMGFAYVDFTSPDQKIIAISLSERDFQGRPLLIKDGEDFKGRPAKTVEPSADDGSESQGAVKPGMSKWQQATLKKQKNPPSQTLFLGNLSFESTDKSIRQLFEAHRERRSVDEDDGDKWLKKVRLGTFEDTGKCKGWAFVDFTQTEYATEVLLNYRNHKLDGRQLVVEYATADAVRRGGGAVSGADGSAKIPGGKPTNKRAQKKGPRQMRKEARAAKEAADREGGVAPADPANAPPAAASIYSGRQRGPKNEKQRREPRTRAPPGAALAHAQRESTAIVPSKGNKIVF